MHARSSSRAKESVFPEEPENALSASSLERLEALFPGEFDRSVTLGVTWASVTETLRSAELTEEEKRFVVLHHRSREDYDRPGLTDKNRFSADIGTDLARLLPTDDRDAANLLMYLGPRLLSETYGEGVLLWVWHMLTTQVVAEHVRTAFEKYLSSHTRVVGSPERFESLMKARNTLWRTHRRSELPDILALYALLLALPEFVERMNSRGLGGEFSGLSLERVETLRDHQKARVRGWKWKDVDSEGRDISDDADRVDVNLFQITPEGYAFAVTRDWSGRGYGLYLDSPVGIALMDERGLPVALTGFSLRDADTLFVNQFQQVAHDVYDRHGRTLGNRVDEIAKRLPWQKRFFELLREFARERGCSKIVLQSGENNPWTETPRERLDEENGRTVAVPVDVPHLSKKIARKIYDSFAMDHGFVPEEESGDWVLRI